MSLRHMLGSIDAQRKQMMHSIGAAGRGHPGGRRYGWHFFFVYLWERFVVGSQLVTRDKG